MSHNIGLASDERLRLMEQKKQKSEAFIGFFKETSVAPELISHILEAKKFATIKQSD